MGQGFDYAKEKEVTSQTLTIVRHKSDHYPIMLEF